MKRIFAVILLLITLLSCRKEVDWPEPLTDTKCVTLMIAFNPAGPFVDTSAHWHNVQYMELEQWKKAASEPPFEWCGVWTKVVISNPCK